MRPSYLSRLTFETFRTIEELKNKCREIDTTEALVRRHNKMFPIPYAEPSFQYRSRIVPATRHHMNEMEECTSNNSSTEDDEVVEAIASNPKPVYEENRQKSMRIKPKKKECYNCKAEGHYFKDCPRKRFREFCTRCGCPGVKTTDCRQCRTPLGN